MGTFFDMASGMQEGIELARAEIKARWIRPLSKRLDQVNVFPKA